MINASYLLKTAHLKRAVFVGAVLTFSFLLISFCALEAEGDLVFFWIALVAAICTGSVTALGEGTTLGYLKGFPTECMGYFGSGTGFAGIFGTGLLLLLKVFDL
jgi:CLN3 protein